MRGGSIEQLRANGRKGGRPKYPKTIAKEKMREYLVEQIRLNFGPILQGQIELAKGLYEERVLDGQKTIVYKNRPDKAAAEYLLNQSIGKATETLKVEEEVRLKLDI